MKDPEELPKDAKIEKTKKGTSYSYYDKRKGTTVYGFTPKKSKKSRLKKHLNKFVQLFDFRELQKIFI
jgi:hypothetical protein